MKKYTDVDIFAELQKLVDSHVDSYKEDFDIDKRIIHRAAESQNPEDKTLMWFCRPHGTHCPVSYTHLDVYKRQPLGSP